MKILIVSGDDALVSSLTAELETRDFEVLPTHFGDGGLSLYKKDGPFAFVLVDYRFIPGTRIKDCVELVTTIHLINPFQQMAIMSASHREARERPQALHNVPVLRKPFRIEQLLGLLRQPVLPLSFVHHPDVSYSPVPTSPRFIPRTLGTTI
jgi:DNA-binding response OmpR family regulator